MQTVVLLPTFERDAEAAGLDEETLFEIVSAIASDPRTGDLMVGTGGARKRRHAKPGGGKSGGYRTIHYYAGDGLPVFLLALFRKGDKDNLSKAERNEVAKLLPVLAKAYATRGRR